MMWMIVWMGLFWAVVIGGALWFLSSWQRTPAGDDAMEVLRTRLASGEITVQEFEARKGSLGQGNQGPTISGSVIAAFIAIALLIAIPTVIMAASDWDMDMWSMGGRGQNTTGDPVFRGGMDENISVGDFTFEPGNLEVPLGATVTWTNRDSAPHDATARNGDWNTAQLSDDESDTLTFTSRGTFDYYCSVHPSMKARLTVR